MSIEMHTTHYRSMTLSLKPAKIFLLRQHACNIYAAVDICSGFFCTEQGISSNLNDISSIQVSLNQINHISHLPHYSRKLQSLLVTPQLGKITYACRAELHGDQQVECTYSTGPAQVFALPKTHPQMLGVICLRCL